jgi:hypothetical protein
MLYVSDKFDDSMIKPVESIVTIMRVEDPWVYVREVSARDTLVSRVHNIEIARRFSEILGRTVYPNRTDRKMENGDLVLLGRRKGEKIIWFSVQVSYPGLK